MSNELTEKDIHEFHVCGICNGADAITDLGLLVAFSCQHSADYDKYTLVKGDKDALISIYRLGGLPAIVAYHKENSK